MTPEYRKTREQFDYAVKLFRKVPNAGNYVFLEFAMLALQWHTSNANASHFEANAAADEIRKEFVNARGLGKTGD